MSTQNMAGALSEALEASPTPPVDGAALQLATRYAQLLDQAYGDEEEVKVYAEIGPKYLAVLQSLGLTLAGRSTKTGTGGGTNDVPGTRKLDELRARRAARVG